MDTFVIVIIIVCAGIVLPSLVLCCVLKHRKQRPIVSQSRDLEMGQTGSKDGGLVVLTRNVSTTATTVAAAVMEEEMVVVVEGAAAVEAKRVRLLLWMSWFNLFLSWFNY
ncbi:hypothetical protein DY000_02010526 [Brassica cretica]|uniref:Transmembrane protein n=1 Tax=Brassica cretica TaxID=69181 RepID=A0ABQ7CGP0_BRACR|nr:hypothetical protein DY000_02010526 [Brassica cretica]